MVFTRGAHAATPDITPIVLCFMDQRGNKSRKCEGPVLVDFNLKPLGLT